MSEVKETGDTAAEALMDTTEAKPEAEASEAKVEVAVEAAAEAEAEVKADADADTKTETVEAAADGGEAAAAGVSGSTAQKRQREPVKLGYKEFKSRDDACTYFKHLMHIAPKNINVNDYEHKVLHELLQRGHPNADKKIGVGLLGFQVREFNDAGALAFYVVRTDQTAEDFSYLKCCAALFPDDSGPPANRCAKKPQGAARPSSDAGSGGRGNARGRGRGRAWGRGRGRK